MNDAERYQLVRRFFLEVSEIPPRDVAAFLDRACDDPLVRRDVLHLLEGNEHQTGDLATPVQREAEAIQQDHPKRLGAYSVIRCIGRGGMGEVYEAQQESPQRRVALKVIRPGVGRSELVRRFENESRALGLLRHPGIAQIYDAGAVVEDGRSTPYFTMELVDGVPITQFVTLEHASLDDRLALLASVCDAVHYAHQRGVIHRDLKPGNILVEQPDEGGVASPKILDFGVARLTDADVQSATLQTEAGQIIGTLAYMSPEQVRGNPDEIDTRADVYALGALGFELLSGSPPHDFAHAPITEAASIIEGRDAPRLGTLRREFRGDIETIIGRALEKEKERRYGSAAELASDIRRYLAHEPIVARPASGMYHLRKFARRNRALVGGVVATIIALMVGLAGTVIFAAGEARQRDRAQQRADELQVVSEFQSGMLSELDPNSMGISLLTGLMQGLRDAGARDQADAAQIESEIRRFQDLLVRSTATEVALDLIDEHVLTRAVATIDTRFASQPVLDAALRQTIADVYRDLGRLETALPQQERALALRTEALGDQHPDTLASMSRAALLLQGLGRLEESEELARRALDVQRAALGDDDPATLMTLNNLGMLLRRMGRYDEARVCYAEVLEGRRRVLGTDHRETLATMNNAALLAKAAGEFQDAESLYRDGLERCIRALGEDDPLTLSTIANLGALLSDTGREDEAVEYYTTALEGRRRVLGNDHPETMTSINNLGYLLNRMGRREEALPFTREALERRRAALGPRHPSTASSLNNLAGLLRRLGQQAEAEPLQREALDIWRSALGAEHPRTLLGTTNLGSILRDLGQPDEAVRLGAMACEGGRTGMPEEHWTLGYHLYEYGLTLVAAERHDDARRVLDESVAILEARLGQDDQRTRDAVAALDDLPE